MRTLLPAIALLVLSCGWHGAEIESDLTGVWRGTASDSVHWAMQIVDERGDLAGTYAATPGGEGYVEGTYGNVNVSLRFHAVPTDPDVPPRCEFRGTLLVVDSERIHGSMRCGSGEAAELLLIRWVPG